MQGAAASRGAQEVAAMSLAFVAALAAAWQLCAALVLWLWLRGH